MISCILQYHVSCGRQVYRRVTPVRFWRELEALYMVLCIYIYIYIIDDADEINRLLRGDCEYIIIIIISAVTAKASSSARRIIFSAAFFFSVCVACTLHVSCTLQLMSPPSNMTLYDYMKFSNETLHYKVRLGRCYRRYYKLPKKCIGF